MLEDYEAPDGEGGICPKMDELLCEYVDGTMDPTVQDVFEECICADPVLAERVHELRGTRSLLNRYGHKLRHVGQSNSPYLKQRGRRDDSEVPSSPPPRQVRMSTLIAAVAASLVVGMLAGKAVFGAASQKQNIAQKEYTPIHKPVPRSFNREAVHNTLSRSGFSTQTYHNIFDTSTNSTSSGRE